MAEIGEVIRGRYRVKEELGRGGVATVYLVEDLNLGVDRALKELSASFAVIPEYRDRFLQEAQLQASLVHPNIVTIHDHFVWEQTPFIVMEYLALGDTRKLVLALKHEQVAVLIAAVLSGLDAAEQAGILHRDLKPDNLLRTNDGSVKIGDFGIAKTVQGDLQLTEENLLPGTAAYVAPELLLPGRFPTPASDLYSVGVVAYELLRGFSPFASDRPTPQEILFRKRTEETVPISVVVQDLHIEIASWIDRLLARDPQRRYQRAADAREALEERAERAFTSGWLKLGVLPVEDKPRKWSPTATDPASHFIGQKELTRIVENPLRLVAWAVTRPSTWLVTAAVVAAAFAFDELWLFGVAVVGFAGLASLTYFDQREAYRARGVGRRRRQRQAPDGSLVEFG